MISLTNLPESHTGKNIYTVLNDKLSDWNLNETEAKIVFVTDNGRNFIAAMGFSDDWEHVCCFAHTLQLVVTDSLKVRLFFVITEKDSYFFQSFIYYYFIGNGRIIPV